jgi:L-asparaginase
LRKRVHVFYTGGTIGMRRDRGGRLVPDRDYLPGEMRAMPELRWDDPDRRNPLMPRWDVAVRDKLLDSSNMTPGDWFAIASHIRDLYAERDGFVILHGTDTMAYTASALAFMLEGLAKPVVLTGSQVPLAEVRNDARENLITALMIAGNYGLERPEVCLYVGRRLLRGCRAVKVSADGFGAFDSPNLPPLATVGVDIEFNRHVRPPPAPRRGTAFRVQEVAGVEIATLRLFPGISAEITRNILRAPLQGLVIEAYGTGNGPSGADNRDFLTALEEAVCRRKVVVVACTQCLRGRVTPGEYETGLGRVGVIGGGDMTPEAALAKMAYLFSRGDPPERVMLAMQRNLRGELTPKEPPRLPECLARRGAGRARSGGSARQGSARRREGPRPWPPTSSSP